MNSRDPTDGQGVDAPGKKRRWRAPPPIEVTVEVNWVTGDQAEDLAHRQWLVIKEVLHWTIDHPRPEQEAEMPGTGLQNEE